MQKILTAEDGYREPDAWLKYNHTKRLLVVSGGSYTGLFRNKEQRNG